MGQECSAETRERFEFEITIGDFSQRKLPPVVSKQENLDSSVLHTDRFGGKSQVVKSRIVEVPKEEKPKRGAETMKALDLKFYDQLLQNGILEEFDYGEDRQRLSDGCEYRSGVEIKGQKYEGEWRNNKKHGKGFQQTANQRYLGWFYDGSKHQFGRQIMTDEVYEGEFAFGKRNGQGVRYCRDRTERGRFDGVIQSGRVQYKDGSFYDGTFQDGLKSTEIDRPGHFVWPDGVKYVGQFKQDMMNGTGRMTFGEPANRIYEGQWKNDKKHGRGIFTWKDPRREMLDKIYDGEYENGLKHGKGIYVWKRRQMHPGQLIENIYYYHGEFMQDVPHGIGEIRDHRGIRNNVQFHFGRQLNDQL